MQQIREIKKFRTYGCARTANPKYERDRHNTIANELSRAECTKCCGRKYLPDGALPPPIEDPHDEEL